MTKKKRELLDVLRALRLVSDKEKAHVIADEALIKYIKDLEIANAYHEIDKWYA